MRRVAAALLALALAAGFGSGGRPAAAGATGPAAGVIARYRVQIPALMAQQDVPGLAVALVDRRRLLWVAGFGHVDGPLPRSPPTPSSASSRSCLADDGETLELGGRVPTWRSLRLVRVSGGPAAWQWTVRGAAALAASPGWPAGCCGRPA